MSPKTAAGTPSGLVDLESLAQAAECLRTLAHPHRLRMVEMLLDDRYTVGELAQSCGIPSPVASGHLRLMQRCGLLTQQREGRRIYYRVCEPCLKDFLTCVRKRFGCRS
jgi:DNA-binding transcriptional ArsR family regulator